VAWTSAVLHHAERPMALLGEMARVVRPGGLVAVLDNDTAGSFPVLPWPPDLEQRLRAAAWAGQEANFDGTLGHHFDGYVGRLLPQLLREAGLRDIQMHALPDLDRAPLDPPREAEIGGWFAGPFARRLRDFLAPRDLARLLALFDPQSPDYFLASPDFFMARLSFLGLGRVPGDR
jgi:SAM-dependent methyltransferase